MRINKQTLVNIVMIFIGTCIFSFGIVNFNIANHLAEGGLTGIALILYNLVNISPAITTLVLNIPLILIGLKFLGLEAIFLTIIGSVALSFNLWLWQMIPITISVENDLLIAAILAGLFGGLGSGLVYKFGGTTGGTDIAARIIEMKTGLTIGRSLLLLDVIILLLSLSYVSIKQMMYTLIAVFVFSKIVDVVQGASYGARAILVISKHDREIGEQIMQQLGRGMTYIKTEGGYSKQPKDMLYCVASLSEMSLIKEIVHQIDPHAFVTMLNISEVSGEGFTFVPHDSD